MIYETPCNNAFHDDTLARINELIDVISQVRAQTNGDLIEESFDLSKARAALKAVKDRVSGAKPLDDAKIASTPLV